MPLEEEVRHIAELAHLDLTDEEIRRLVPQLGAILAYVGKLNELDTAVAEAMTNVAAGQRADATLRADEERQAAICGAALESAPEPGGDFFKVPRVIERE